MTRELKHWYNSHDKDFISDALTNLDRKNMMISKYSSIFKMKNGDFALCLVKFHPRLNMLNESHAQSLSFNKGHKNKLTTTQVWLAKFFGLYFKEQRCLEFSENDFDGRDILMALEYPTKLDNNNEDSSIISQKNMTYKFDVDDSSNSGIYCLGYFLAQIQKINATST